jgi:phospholipid-binding lipoprotein MlaA
VENQVKNKMQFCSNFIAAFVVVLVLAGCATKPPASDKGATQEYQEINDPIEPTNRVIFEFNRALDEVILQPVARAYRVVIPSWVRARITSALDNLRAPVVFFNELAQGEPKRAASTLVRFGFNTTFGLAGLNDFARELGFEKTDEDFGQTLAIWGVGSGPYLMLPIFGPSNPRDAVGRVVDIVIDPFNMWTRNVDREALTYARAGTEIVSTREHLLDLTDDLEKSSLDLYAAVRSLYRQRRVNEIHNGHVDDLSTIPGVTNYPSWDNSIPNEEISTKP